MTTQAIKQLLKHTDKLIDTIELARPFAVPTTPLKLTLQRAINALYQAKLNLNDALKHAK